MKSALKDFLVWEQFALTADDSDAASGKGAVSDEGKLPSVDGFWQGEVEMETARGTRADDQVAHEAEAFHRSEDGLEAVAVGMEGTMDVDVEHQIVGELSEALADDVVAPVVRLYGFEGEGHLLRAATAFDGNPAAIGEEDG